jgi:hypothetical protein
LLTTSPFAEASAHRFERAAAQPDGLVVAKQVAAARVEPEAAEADLVAIHRIDPNQSNWLVFKVLKQRP